MDGATNFQVFWKIKWPSIMPTTLYVVVITTINSFQCFALIQLLTRGGPDYSTSTIMYLLYETAFQTSKNYATPTPWASSWPCSSPCSAPSSSR